MGRTIPGMGLTVILAILTVGCAITILCINRYQLTNWYFTACTPYWFTLYPSYYCTTYYSCLWNKYGDSDLCSYTYAVGAVSLMVSAITACCQIGGGAMAKVMGDIWLSIFGFVWWVIAAAIFTSNYNTANDNMVPQKSWRCGIMAVCWAATGLYFIWFFLSICLCVTARKAERKEEREERRERHHEMAAEPAPLYDYPPPPQPQYPAQYPPPTPDYGQPGYGQPGYGAPAPYSVPPPNKY